MAEDSENEEIQHVLESRLAPSSRVGYMGALKYFKEWLKQSEKYQDLVVDGEIDAHRLTVGVIQTFLVSQQNRETSEGVSDGVGISRLRQHRSAIRFLLEEKKVCNANVIFGELKQFFAGLKRIDAKNRRAGVNPKIKTQEGKSALRFSLLREVSLKFLKSGEARELWAHCYSLLSWNLMCRCNNTADIHIGRMSWIDDAMGVCFAMTKTDQAGTPCPLYQSTP